MNFYSFLREDGDEVIRYTFYTDNSLTYIAYFYKALAFSPYFEGNKYLCENGWVAGFHPAEEATKIPADYKISNTISQIFQDFLSDKLPDAVIIYHCDDDNEQQHARSRKFNGWFERVKSKFNLTLKVTEIDILKGEEVLTHYIGCIYSNDLREKIIIDELENFSQYLLLTLRK